MSNKALTKAPTPPKAPIPPLIPSSAEDLFTKFMKVFIETTQAQVLAKPQERLLKARTPETYWGKSPIECYHFCQQCEDHFETFGATGTNCTPFTASFLRGFINVRWAKHKRRHKSATPIIWSEFKAFLQKDSGSSQAFIDSISSKFKKDSQYQLEEVRDWASHIQHLQSILSEFDRAPNELTMICYFWEGLKYSIKVEMEQQDREAMDFEEMVQRAVNAKAKAGLRSSAMVRDSDICCPRGHRPFNSIASKVQTQGTSAKKPRPEESRTKEAKQAKGKALAPPRTNAAEPSEQGKKDGKDKKRRFWEKRTRSEETPATEVNIKVLKKKVKTRCFNCNKKNHYANDYTEPRHKPPKN